MTLIPIQKIHVEKRLRPINDDRVASLAASIGDVGLLQPIVVRENGKGYVLVAGAHRLEAARRINWREINANVLGLNELESELAEIDENLMRNELSVLERGEHLARRKTVYEELHPETKAWIAGGKARQGAANEIISFAEDTSGRIGVSTRTVEQEVKIAKDIAPDVKERIRGGELANTKTQLIALAQKPHEEQRKIVAEIESGKRFSVTQDLPKPNRTQFTGENEWYTPKEHIERARTALGGIDLDPATSHDAQKVIKARRFFTAEDDGLKRPWTGRIWLNPPYAQPLIQQFVEKLIAEYGAGRTTEAVMLTHNYTDTAWFHIAAKACAAICFTRGRVKFYNSDGEVAAPTQGQAFFYFGANVDTFKEAFGDIGFIATIPKA